MRLLICDANESEVHSALSHLKFTGKVSVLLNPDWIKPDPSEPLWIACGKPAVDMVQKSGWIPKKGGVEALRGKLFSGVQPEGWSSPISLGITYAPQVRHIDYANFVLFQTDINLYSRYERFGHMEPVLGHYAYAEDFSGVIAYLKAVHEATGDPVELAVDTETEGLNPFDETKSIVCVQMTAKPGLADVVYTLGASPEKLDTVIAQLNWIFSQNWIRIVGANFKYDMLWFRVKWGLEVKNFTFDTCNGASLLEENRPNTLNVHTKIYVPELGGYDDSFNAHHDKSKMGQVPKHDLLPYAGGDTDACLQVYRKVREELLQDNLTANGKPAKNSLASLYVNIVQPTLKALHRMEHTGVCVDVEKFHAFGADLEARMDEATMKAAEILPKTLTDKYGGLLPNGGAPLSKPKMIADFLFSPKGLNLKPTITTEKTGAPSTSEHHLSQFKDHEEAGPLLEAYLDYKSTSKMHGTYYKGFLEHLRSDNRWHASYIIHKQGKGRDNEQNAGGTLTGRGSATDPAFQCVAGETEILTPHGIRRAESLIDPIIPERSFNPFVAHETTIWGREGWESTSNVFRSWRADLLRVKVKCGNELVCTPEHPILVSMHAGEKKVQWVSARDLYERDEIAFPEKVERPPAPEWVTPQLAEALGMIAAVGYLSMTGDMVFLEFPEDDCADLVLSAFQTLGLSVNKDEVYDAGITTYVVSFSVAGALPPRVAEFLLWLPEGAGEVIPFELRGTERIYDIFRGVFKAAGEYYTARRGWKGVKIRVKSKSLAMALLRETMLEGASPPFIRPRKDHYLLEWVGAGAGRMLKGAGLPLMGCRTESPIRKDNPYPSLEIVSVEPAGAGWVYDFTLPKTHAFLANSMMVHNTVPKHSYWGKRLRECIIAPPDHVIVARDYSQGELKVTACWAGEQKMIEAYQSGIDLHVLTAATVNGMTYEEAMFLKSKDEAAFKYLRQNGKAGNFGLIYGMQAYGFMLYAAAVYGVNLTLEQAEAMRDAFFDLYPGLIPWHERQILEAETTGAVRSPLGRLRHLPNIHSPLKDIRKKSQNQAINSPIQATLVDMMWWSMAIIERERPQLLTACGQIHDQGIWYAPESMVDEAVAYSGEVMEHLPFEEKFGWKPELVFTTDAEVGYNLAELKEV